jgi:hypothetical protein
MVVDSNTPFLDEEKLEILEDVFLRPFVKKKEETLKNKYTFQIHKLSP